MERPTFWDHGDVMDYLREVEAEAERLRARLADTEHVTQKYMRKTETYRATLTRIANAESGVWGRIAQEGLDGDV